MFLVLSASCAFPNCYQCWFKTLDVNGSTWSTLSQSYFSLHFMFMKAGASFFLSIWTKRLQIIFFYHSGNKDPISRPQIFLFIPLHFLYSMYKNFKNKNNTNKNVIKIMYLSLILQSKSWNYTLLYLFAPNNPWPNCAQDSCHWQRCLSILTVCWDINKRAKTELFSENVFLFLVLHWLWKIYLVLSHLENVLQCHTVDF